MTEAVATGDKKPDTVPETKVTIFIITLKYDVFMIGGGVPKSFYRTEPP